MSFIARFFDGQSNQPQDVRVDATESGLRLSDSRGHTLRDWPWSEVFIVSKPAAGMKGTLGHLQEDACRLVVPDDAWKPFIAPYAKVIRTGLPDGGLKFALTVLCIFVVLIAAGPSILDRAALFVPDSWQDALGEASVKVLAGENKTCRANPLADAALNRVAATLDADHKPMKLHIVASRDINALTTTGRNMIIFSGLLRAAPTPQSLAGVMAHEIGHAHFHHPIRSLVRDEGMMMLATTLTGSSGQNLAGAANTLLSLKNSRAFEAQADDYSVDAMARNNYDPRGLVVFLKVMGTLKVGQDEDSDWAPEWIMSHPETQHRVATLENKIAHMPAVQKPYAQPFTSAEWAAIKHYCDIEMRTLPAAPAHPKKDAPHMPGDLPPPSWQRAPAPQSQPI